MIELTEPILEKLCSYVKMGAPLDTAALAEAIPIGDLNEWIGMARTARDGIYSTMQSRLAQARAQGEILHIQRIVSNGTPKESQWMLERMYPETWGPKHPDPKKKAETASVIEAAFTERSGSNKKRIEHKRR